MLALAGLAGTLKSSYNGWVRRTILAPLNQIQQISNQVERVEDNQEDMADQQVLLTDAVIALGRSHEEEDRTFNVRVFREESGREDRSKDLLDD